jgi:multisubunit Na+/H+ antiporter MnhE subunit
MNTFLALGWMIFVFYLFAFAIPGFIAGAIVGLVHACRRPRLTQRERYAQQVGFYLNG